MQLGRVPEIRLRKVARRAAAWSVASVLLLMSPLAGADRTKLKPGWNIFSEAQDVEMGKKLSAAAESQLPMLDDLRVNGYLNRLGRKLAEFAPGTKYPYEFHCVNSKQVNSFALPGGQVYIYRGVIEEADDEAQLAGVMAHEISHVLLRHGTNQATRQEMSTGLFGILGGVVGGGSVSAITSQLSNGVIVGSVLVRYSRTAETQADILGTQMLYDAGYDPRAMAQFFENQQNDTKKKGRVAALFADHPVPERRIERVGDEIDKLGGPPKDYKTDSPEFREVRRYILSLPISTEKNLRAAMGNPNPDPADPKDAPPTLRHASPDDGSFRRYTGDSFTAQYPGDWEALGRGDSVAFVPHADKDDGSQEAPQVGLGVLVNVFQPPAGEAPKSSSAKGTSGPVDVSFKSQQSAPRSGLDIAADQLLARLKQSSPNLKASDVREKIEIDGQTALSMKLTNHSPLGGLETEWLIAVMQPQGMLYFVCAAPASEYPDYEATFQQIISSVRLSQ